MVSNWHIYQPRAPVFGQVLVPVVFRRFLVQRGLTRREGAGYSTSPFGRGPAQQADDAGSSIFNDPHSLGRRGSARSFPVYPGLVWFDSRPATASAHACGPSPPSKGPTAWGGLLVLPGAATPGRLCPSLLRGDRQLQATIDALHRDARHWPTSTSYAHMLVVWTAARSGPYRGTLRQHIHKSLCAALPIEGTEAVVRRLTPARVDGSFHSQKDGTKRVPTSDAETASKPGEAPRN